MIEEKVVKFIEERKIIFFTSDKMKFKDLKELLDRGRLELSDWFQRDYSWDKNQEVNFVHTVLNHPELIPQVVVLRDEHISGTKQDPMYYVADGQHRLRSILGRVLGNPNFKYKSKELSKYTSYYGVHPKHADWQKFVDELLSKSIEIKPIVNYGCNESELDEVKSYIFRKWNNGSNVNAAEKRAAIPSDLNNMVIRPLLSSVMNKDLFLQGKSKRANFNELLEKFWFHYYKSDVRKDPGQPEMNSLHDDSLEDDKKKVSEFLRIVKGVSKVLDSIKTTLAFEATCQRDLIVFCISLLKKGTDGGLRNITEFEDYLKSTLEKFHEVYVKTEKFTDWNKEIPNDPVMQQYVPFYRDFHANYGTAQTGEIKFSARMKFLDKQKSYLGEIGQYDTKRIFTKFQREQMWYSQDGLCVGLDGLCGFTSGQLDLKDMDADHIKEHSTGGLTDVSNGQLLCKGCHREKTRRFVSKVVES
jgi:hypothetical protein